MTPKIHTVIFDMDGVLVDSERLINAAAIAMIRENELVVQSEDFLSLVGAGEDRSISGVAEKYRFPVDLPKAKQRTYEIYLDLVLARHEAFPRAYKVMHACHQAGLRLADIVRNTLSQVRLRASVPDASAGELA